MQLLQFCPLFKIRAEIPTRVRKLSVLSMAANYFGYSQSSVISWAKKQCCEISAYHCKQ